MAHAHQRPETALADVKIDLRALRDKVNGLRDKMDEMNARFDGKFDILKHSIHSAKVWALVLYAALAGTRGAASR